MFFVDAYSISELKHSIEGSSWPTIVAQDHVAEVKSRKKGQGFSIIDISKMSIYGCFWMLIQFLNIMIQLGL